MKRTLLTFFAAVFSLFFISFVLVSADDNNTGIRLYKDNPSNSALPLAADNDTINRGQTIYVSIFKNEPPKKFRQIAVFAPTKKNPTTPYHIVTMTSSGGACNINIGNDGGRGIWSPGIPIYNEAFTGTEPIANCNGNSAFTLNLRPDQFFNCGPNGSKCEIRISKDGSVFRKDDGTLLTGSELESATSSRTSFFLNDPTQNPNGTAPNVSLSSSTITSGDKITATVTGLEQDQDYDVLVTFEGNTSTSDQSQNFGQGTLHTTCNDRAFTPGGSQSFGQALKGGQVNGIPGCFRNAYYISIDTTGYVCGGDGSKCELRVWKRSNGPVGKATFSASTSKIAFQSPTNNSTIPWGAKQTIQIIKIPKMTSGDAKYTLSLKDSQNNEKGKYNFEIKKDGVTADGCKVNDVSDSTATDKLFIYRSGGESNSCYFNTTSGVKDTFSNVVALNTTRLGKPKSNEKYTLTLSVDDAHKSVLPQPITTQFSLGFTASIEMTPAEKYTGTEKDPKYKFEFFESTKVDISMKGCPAGTDVGFLWWRGNDDISDAKSQGSDSYSSDKSHKPDPDDHMDSVTVGSNGTATFSNDFGNNGKNEPYFMRAWCLADKNAKSAAEVDFRVWGRGEEFLTVPTEILANKQFDITAGGLEPAECYYILLWDSDKNDTDDGTADYITGGDVQACNDSAEGKIDTPRRDKYLAKSDKWPASSPISVPNGLPAGHYKAKLFIPNNSEGSASFVGDNCGSNDLCDDGKADTAFCVELCRNDGQEYPPGRAPCLIGTDKEDKVIDARPEKDRKDNPYTYVDKNGNKLTAEAGSRDQILTCTVVPTAFGNIDTSPQGIVKSLLQILLSIAGSVAFILILIAGYKIMTSRGNPEQIQDAKEQLTSAIVGLLFIIFSVVLIQTIGVDLLHIPGFKP